MLSAPPDTTGGARDQQAAAHQKRISAAAPGDLAGHPELTVLTVHPGAANVKPFVAPGHRDRAVTRSAIRHRTDPAPRAGR